MEVEHPLLMGCKCGAGVIEPASSMVDLEPLRVCRAAMIALSILLVDQCPVLRVRPIPLFPCHLTAPPLRGSFGRSPFLVMIVESRNYLPPYFTHSPSHAVHPCRSKRRVFLAVSIPPHVSHRHNHPIPTTHFSTRSRPTTCPSGRSKGGRPGGRLERMVGGLRAGERTRARAARRQVGERQERPRLV